MVKGNRILTTFIMTILWPVLAMGQSYYKFGPHSVSTRNYDEVAPVLIREGMVFISTLEEGSIAKYKMPDDLSFTKIFFAAKGENEGEWKTPIAFSEVLRTNQNDGPVSFNFNEDLIAFNRHFELTGFGGSRSINPNIGIYFADFEEEHWTNIREYEFNDRESMNLHPALNASGNRLYFSSDRPGGYGGFDLYVSEFKNGKWNEPKNLGPVINTSANELYPFVHATGRLYFSSNGHDNIGGYDIFYSEFFNNRWFPAVKLMAPFNSGLNDFTYYANEDFSYGFYSTNRRGSMDIFEFRSTLPEFEICKKQVENNYCYLFYEENTILLDTAIYQYEWDTGDGTKVTAMQAEHCYKEPGDYLVQLNVVDRLTGIVEFNQAEYLVEVRKVIQPYITCPDTLTLNEEAQMHGLESYFGDMNPGEYFWDFGDGNRAVGITSLHKYEVPGIYQVKLGMMEENEDSDNARRFCAYKTVVVKE